MAIDPHQLDDREGQVSGLLDYLPTIFRQAPDDASDPPAPLPIGRFLMAFEGLFLGLPKNRHEEWRDLLHQPGFEEILGGASQRGTSEPLLVGIQRYFDPGRHHPLDPAKIEDYDQAPSGFLTWLAGWVALTLRDDWTDDHQRNFIAKAAQLYRLRGTKAGVLQFIQVYTGNLPVEISELNERFQIGDHSRVGVDTWLDGGAPFFFRVRVKLGLQDIQKQTEVLKAIIDLQKPAHTNFKLELDTIRFQIGEHSTIGVDTLLGVPLK